MISIRRFLPSLFLSLTCTSILCPSSYCDTSGRLEQKHVVSWGRGINNEINQVSRQWSMPVVALGILETENLSDRTEIDFVQTVKYLTERSDSSAVYSDGLLTVGARNRTFSMPLWSGTVKGLPSSFLAATLPQRDELLEKSVPLQQLTATGRQTLESLLAGYVDGKELQRVLGMESAVVRLEFVPQVLLFRAGRSGVLEGIIPLNDVRTSGGESIGDKAAPGQGSDVIPQAIDIQREDGLWALDELCAHLTAKGIKSYADKTVGQEKVFISNGRCRPDLIFRALQRIFNLEIRQIGDSRFLTKSRFGVTPKESVTKYLSNLSLNDPQTIAAYADSIRRFTARIDQSAFPVEDILTAKEYAFDELDIAKQSAIIRAYVGGPVSINKEKELRINFLVNSVHLWLNPQFYLKVQYGSAEKPDETIVVLS